MLPGVVHQEVLGPVRRIVELSQQLVMREQEFIRKYPFHLQSSAPSRQSHGCFLSIPLTHTLPQLPPHRRVERR
jgi:hypothetical protein